MLKWVRFLLYPHHSSPWRPDTHLEGVISLTPSLPPGPAALGEWEMALPDVPGQYDWSPAPGWSQKDNVGEGAESCMSGKLEDMRVAWPWVTVDGGEKSKGRVVPLAGPKLKTGNQSLTIFLTFSQQTWKVKIALPIFQMGKLRLKDEPGQGLKTAMICDFPTVPCIGWGSADGSGWSPLSPVLRPAAWQGARLGLECPRWPHLLGHLSIEPLLGR